MQSIDQIEKIKHDKAIEERKRFMNSNVMSV